MREKVLSQIAGIVFLLIALGHLGPVVFKVSFVVQDITVPVWVAVAVIIAACLSYQGFHFSRK